MPKDNEMSVTLTVAELHELVYGACTKAVQEALSGKSQDTPQLDYGVRGFMRWTGWGRTKASQALQSGDFDRCVDRSRRPIVVNVPKLLKLIKP